MFGACTPTTADQDHSDETDGIVVATDHIKTNSIKFPVPKGKSWRVDVDQEFAGNYEGQVFWISC